MSTQICPNCNKDSFTWTINDEETILTKWGCINCKYIAFENESDERKCLKCDKKTEIKLKDEDKEYWWCGICNIVTEINEKQ